ncbi:MAG: glycine zipper 2TM domain-containing protein [Alphaproteobacteria bacterium]|nr:glycine zipper 2TM domain-containing protein [Alphaproteobacteria bacterium]
MRALIASAMAAAMLTGCMSSGNDRRPDTSWRQYDYNRPDPNYGGYYADRYYREDSRHRERRLSRSDRVYRGQDGRYYCRRSDGSTGLVVGAIAGGILGNIIAPGGSETLGTILGAGAGALAGREIDRGGDARCR